MSFLPILDVAIGVVFVYLLLALLGTAINEAIAGWTKRRAKFLDLGLSRLLRSDELKRAFYNHSLIRSLARSDAAVDPSYGPSYIPADKFSLVLRDLITGSGTSSSDLQAFAHNLAGYPELQAALRPLIENSPGPAELDRALRDWFNDAMDRVSGWYKRNAQAWSLALAVAITVTLNADTFRIIEILWASPTLRAAVVEEAGARARQERPAELLPMVVYTDPEKPDEGLPVELKNPWTEREQELLGNLMGWTVDRAQLADERKLRQSKAGDWGWGHLMGLYWWWLRWLLQQHLLGWFVTAVAVSVGAPFWFDTLNWLINLRNAGRRPETEDDSKGGEKK